jgi:hypothetical protein
MIIDNNSWQRGREQGQREVNDELLRRQIRIYLELVYTRLALEEALRSHDATAA